VLDDQIRYRAQEPVQHQRNYKNAKQMKYI
jgi:hypothetical protein